MITYSNKSIWPNEHAEFCGDVPTLEDIAVGLGRQSRFAGQTRDFYTVLCHVIVCSQLVDEMFETHEMRQEIRPYVLHHDDSEAIMGDCPTTWKPEQFKELEEQLLELCAGAFELTYPWPHESIVKAIDYAALQGEAHALGHRRAEQYWPWAEMSPLAIKARDLTQMQLVAGNPVRYLDPGNSIPALRRALQR